MPHPPLTLSHLARRSLALVRDHPRLALPTLAAILLGDIPTYLQQIYRRSMLFTLLSHHDSVLGGSSAMGASKPQMAFAWLVIILVGWTCYFFLTMLYAAAITLTAASVEAAGRGSSLRVNEMAGRLAADRKRILFFTLKAFVTGLLAFLASFLLLWFRLGHIALQSSAGVPSLEFVSVFAILYIVTPAIFALVRPPTAPPITGTPIRLARQAAALTAALLAALPLLLDRIAPLLSPYQTSVPGHVLFHATLAVADSLPYVPFFVAVALLAEESPATTGTPPDEGDLLTPEAF